MLKKYRAVLVLGLLVLVLGISLVRAETEQEFVPWRVRLREILEEDPEILEKIEALRKEYRTAEGERPLSPEGAFRERVQGLRDSRGRRGFCRGPGGHYRRYVPWRTSDWRSFCPFGVR